MDRVNFLLIAGSQFIPFLWIREDLQPEDTDKAWEVRIPKSFPSHAAFRTFSEKFPVFFLYRNYSGMWQELREARAASDAEAERSLMLNTIGIVMGESIMMIAREAGIEDSPLPKNRHLPVGRAAVLGPEKRLKDIWFYDKLLDTDFFGRATDDLLSVVRTRFKMDLARRAKHTSEHPDEPWENTVDGARESIEGLRLLLINVYATVFIRYRVELLLFLHEVVVPYLYTALEPVPERPDYTLYVREYDSPAEASRAYKYYATYGIEMGKKLKFLMDNVPEIGEPEVLSLRMALQAVPIPDQLEPGIWRFYPEVPRVSILSALAALRDASPPKLAWVRYSVPPPKLGHALAEPYLSDTFDPSTFDPAVERLPLVIDLDVHTPEQYSLEPQVWLHEMGNNPAELRIAAALRPRAAGSDITLLDPLDLWNVCFTNPLGEVADVKADRTNEEVTFRGETVQVNILTNPGDFRLIRLRPAEGIHLL